MNLDDWITEHPDALIATDIIPCTTSQWNFPHERTKPWAKDGICSTCGQHVTTTRIRADDPYLYSHIAEPHTRPMRTFAITEDELTTLLLYATEW